VMAVDVARKREELLVLRERILRAANDLAADDEGHGEINSAAGDQHLADHASDLVDLEVDLSLEENAGNVIADPTELAFAKSTGTNCSESLLAAYRVSLEVPVKLPTMRLL